MRDKSNYNALSGGLKSGLKTVFLLLKPSAQIRIFTCAKGAARCNRCEYFLARASQGDLRTKERVRGTTDEREAVYSSRKRRSSASSSARRDSAATRPVRSSSARASAVLARV